jgi:methyltransferase (TIGR00027 family)
MNEASPSATALVVSLIRALHSRTAARPLINDPWGDQLIPESVVTAIGRSMTPSAPDDPAEGGASPGKTGIDALLRASPAYANVVLRSRYTEDALHDAIARGATQYVLIGAGFDSYALRVPQEASHIRIFEIDHPATQGLKVNRLAQCGIDVADSVQFLPADLSRQPLGSVLKNSSFSQTELTFFSLLGVTMYLSPDANRQTMREIANIAAPGSELVFTYISQDMLTAAAASVPEAFTDVQRTVESMGEPFISGFDPLALEQNLRAVGFELQEDLSDIELIQRYDPEGKNALQSAHQSRIARARVTAGGTT